MHRHMQNLQPAGSLQSSTWLCNIAKRKANSSVDAAGSTHPAASPLPLLMVNDSAVCLNTKALKEVSVKIMLMRQLIYRICSTRLMKDSNDKTHNMRCAMICKQGVMALLKMHAQGTLRHLASGEGLNEYRLSALAWRRAENLMFEMLCAVHTAHCAAQTRYIKRFAHFTPQDCTAFCFSIACEIFAVSATEKPLAHLLCSLTRRNLLEHKLILRSNSPNLNRIGSAALFLGNEHCSREMQQLCASQPHLYLCAADRLPLLSDLRRGLGSPIGI